MLELCSNGFFSLLTTQFNRRSMDTTIWKAFFDMGGFAYDPKPIRKCRKSGFTLINVLAQLVDSS